MWVFSIFSPAVTVDELLKVMAHAVVSSTTGLFVFLLVA